MDRKNISDFKITRKQAIRKMGLTALTASTLMLLETKAASSLSDTGIQPGSPRRGRPLR